MRAYFATRLSPNISVTPNGFLICKNVPIARTGKQEYLGSELGLEDERREQVVVVNREESEVFSPETLASFEGAIFTDDHPSNEVTAENVQYLQKGFAKDVRRGSGTDNDKILADIIVTDSITIGKILNSGKREISCGYSCEYVEQNGEFYQRNIRGNHVALVDSGRAGKNVAIKDSKVNNTRKEKFTMAKKKNTKRQSIFAKFMGSITQDADPDIVGELLEEIASNQESCDEEQSPAPKKETEPSPAPAPAEPTEKKDDSKDEGVAEMLKQILERLDKLESSKGADEDELSKLEKEVSGQEEAEKPVEEMDKDEGEEKEENSEGEEASLDECKDESSEEESTESEEKAPAKTSNDNAAIKRAISDAKKAVAAIKDPKQKKIVADSMAKIIRQSYGITPSTPKDSYAAINKVKSSKQRTADKAKGINLEARQSAYDARNPHINKK